MGCGDGRERDGRGHWQRGSVEQAERQRDRPRPETLGNGPAQVRSTTVFTSLYVMLHDLIASTDIFMLSCVVSRLKKTSPDNLR